MAFVVSSLTNYVNEQSTDLLVAAQFGSKTAGLATPYPGVKSSAALQLLATDPIPQDGTSCGFTASGSVTFTQRTISTAPVKFEDSLCPKALQTKWTQLLLSKGQAYDESDVPKAIVDEIMRTIAKTLETADWQGDTSSVSSYLNRYDGIVKIIKAATGTNVATASTWNSTNARAIVKNIISKIPAALKGDPEVKIFMGYDAAETYRQALMDANLYHVATGTGNQEGLMAEGSVHEIIPVHGLDGLTGNTGDNPFIFAFKPSNLFHGFDNTNEEEQVRMWLDGSDQETVKYRVAFRRGWQIAYPSEVVEYSNS